MPAVTRKCIVQSCTNNSKDNPTKIFLTVPKDENRRNDWIRALNLIKITDNGRYTVCEDHFDLEKDSTNWMFYKIMGKKLMLKSDVVPHKNLEIATTTIGSQLTDSEKKT
ncbi:hypothetical protein NQ317_010628 [Molorchus minor]|uniref:THAP-type domain-containing protein n=1 Tax=Molorchus minor TaxID=1323400 RepID=A0ABQ9JBF0_9CUCU|nr:hypothetical protein NQ317_010628 [Molorchus minor]